MIVAEYFPVQTAFHRSLARMPIYHGLQFEIAASEHTENKVLADQFHLSNRFCYEQHYHTAEPIRTAYHDTVAANIPSIMQNNLGAKNQGAKDSGWFGDGLYFSKYADYCMMYAPANLKPPKAGQTA
jgi:hypothetical protein